MKALNVKARSLYVILRKQQLSVFKTVMKPASWENYISQKTGLEEKGTGESVQLRYITAPCDLTAGRENEKMKKQTGDRIKEDTILFKSRLETCLGHFLSFQTVIVVDMYHQ